MRYKSVAVQSNIDGLLLDKAVDYYGEQAEQRWVQIAETIQSPTSLGKAFKRLEADLEWAEGDELPAKGVAKRAASVDSRKSRVTKLSSLLEERVAALKADFEQQAESLRIDYERQAEKLQAENVELQVQLEKQRECSSQCENRLQAEKSKVLGQMEDLRTRNAEISEQLRCTLALQSATYSSEMGSDSANPSLEELFENKVSLLQQEHAEELSDLQSQIAALNDQIETKNFLLDRKDQLIRGSRHGTPPEEIVALKEIHAAELQAKETENVALVMQLKNKIARLEQKEAAASHTHETERLPLGQMDLSGEHLPDPPVSVHSAEVDILPDTHSNGNTAELDSSAEGKVSALCPLVCTSTPPGSGSEIQGVPVDCGRMQHTQTLITVDDSSPSSLVDACGSKPVDSSGGTMILQDTDNQTLQSVKYFRAVTSRVALEEATSGMQTSKAVELLNGSTIEERSAEAGVTEYQAPQSVKHIRAVTSREALEEGISGMQSFKTVELRTIEERSAEGVATKSEGQMPVTTKTSDEVVQSLSPLTHHVGSGEANSADVYVSDSVPLKETTVLTECRSLRLLQTKQCTTTPPVSETTICTAGKLPRMDEVMVSHGLRAGSAPSMYKSEQNTDTCTAGALHRMDEVMVSNGLRAGSAPSVNAEGMTSKIARSGCKISGESQPAAKLRSTTGDVEGGCPGYDEQERVNHHVFSQNSLQHAPLNIAKPPLPFLSLQENCQSATIRSSRRGRSLDRRNAELVHSYRAQDFSDVGAPSSSCSTHSGASSAESGSTNTSSERNGAYLPPIRPASFDSSAEVHKASSNESDSVITVARLRDRQSDATRRHHSEDMGLIRIVSARGVSCVGRRTSRTQTLPVATPRVPAGALRKFPPRAPGCRRDASAEAVRASVDNSRGNIIRSCAWDASHPPGEESVHSEGSADKDKLPLLVYAVPLHERGKQVLVS
jgi:hypothetical protein